MHFADGKFGPMRSGRKTTLWLSVFVALAVHIGFLFIPFSSLTPDMDSGEVLVEIQISQQHQPTPVAADIQPLPEAETPEPEPPEPVPKEEIGESPVEAVEKEVIEPTSAVVKQTPTPLQHRELEHLDNSEKQRLVNTLLTRQFITEPSVTEQLFGKPLPTDNAEQVAEFHYPVRSSMLTMLDKPMPELPFAYQEGLVYFAYDPGVKGDLQRFWDVITPEFSHRTKYGTEIRCIWVLVIVACGWKAP